MEQQSGLGQPKIITRMELQWKLGRLCHGDKWALEAINDLWDMATPLPSNKPGAPEQRILFPERFSKWYLDFQGRVGLGMNRTNAYKTL